MRVVINIGTIEEFKYMQKIIKLSFISWVWLLGIAYAANPSFNATLNIAVGGTNSGTLSIENFFLESSQGTKESGIVSVESTSNNTINLSVAQESSSNLHIMKTELGHTMLSSVRLTESSVTGFSSSYQLKDLPLQFIFQAGIAFNYSDHHSTDTYMCGNVGFMHSNYFTGGSTPWVIFSNNAGMNNYSFTASNSSLGSYVASITCQGESTGIIRYFAVTGVPGSPDTLLIIPYKQYDITFQGMSDVSNISVSIAQSQSSLNSSHAVNVTENPQESGNFNFSSLMPYQYAPNSTWYEDGLGATILANAGLSSNTLLPNYWSGPGSLPISSTDAYITMQINIAFTYNEQNFTCNNIGAAALKLRAPVKGVYYAIWMLMTNNYHYGSNAAYSYGYKYDNQIDCNDSQGDTSPFVIYSWGDQSTFGITPVN
jgi:hypothetical protein